MNADPLQLIARYRSRGVLIDANLLVLLFVGGVDPRLLKRHDRTAGYDEAAFRLLSRILLPFRNRIVITPNVATQASDLARQIKGEWRQQIRESVRKWIGFFSKQERYIRSADATGGDPFVQHGLTDSVLFILAQRDLLLLTDDGALAGYCLAKRLPAVWFEDVRRLVKGLDAHDAVLVS